MKKYLLILIIISARATIADELVAPSVITNNNPADVPAQTDNSKYYYYFNGEALGRALEMYAKSSGQTLNISPEIPQSVLSHTVTGRFDAQSNDQILNILSKRYGINWFTYSGVIYITPQDLVSKTINVNPGSLNALKDALTSQGLLSDRFGFSIFPNLSQVVISGPKRYVEILSEQIKQLSIAPIGEEFAVYRLKYASATDISLSFNGQQIVIPGVATILSNLLSSVNTSTNNGVSSNRVQTGLSGQITEQLRNQVGSMLPQQNSAPMVSSGAAMTTTGSTINGNSTIATSVNGVISTPLIQADNRLNTIIIRGRTANLGIYKQLITLLDVPSPLIQVEVLAINLDEEKLEEAGINWWASIAGTGIGFNANKLTTTPSNNLSFYYGQVNPGQSLINNVTNFMVGLNYLERDNYAQTVARPTLVTTDNIPALISSVETVYLDAPNATTNNQNNIVYNPVAASVTTSLSITPHVIYINNQREIKLSIGLEDGSIRELNNSQNPNMLQNTLNSQAVIREGQSLLIAGYSKTVQSKVLNKVPFLGDIPLLGWFFKNTSTKNRKVVTVYLVTPKIVWSGNIENLKQYIMLDGRKINTVNPYQAAEQQPVAGESRPVTVEKRPFVTTIKAYPTESRSFQVESK